MNLNSTPKICFIIGMMPRTGTNWAYDILMQSNHTGNIGPIWEDNLLNHVETLESAAKKIASSWDSKWKADHQKIEVLRLTESLQKNFELGLEKFIHQQFLTSSCEADNPTYLILKSPNAWHIKPPKTLLQRNKCIILTRNPHDLIASGMASFGWRLFGACNRYIESTKAIVQLNDSCNQCLTISFEDLKENLCESAQQLYNYLDISLPSFDFSSLAVRGKSPTKKNEKMTWTAQGITSKEQIQKDKTSKIFMSKIQHMVVSELCITAGKSLGYSFGAQKTPNVVRWGIRAAFRLFCFVRKLKG